MTVAEAIRFNKELSWVILSNEHRARALSRDMVVNLAPVHHVLTYREHLVGTAQAMRALINSIPREHDD